jgi:hypothetical protein
MKTLILSTALCLLSIPQTYAGEILNPARESSSVAETRRQALLEIEREMTEKMTQIESDLASRNHRAALNLAKQILDTVRAKTGIDPKVRREESFLVATTFHKDAKVFKDLPSAQQLEVIDAVADFRGGLYMDIMNLSKRVTLLYIKALKAQMEELGGLTQDDKNKIVNDLVRASVVPMKIEDKKGKTIIATDEDIANEDHIYMFNRELKQFIISSSELGITEVDFDKKRKELKESFAPRVVVPQTNALDFARRCVSAARAGNAYANNLDSALRICVANYAASPAPTYEGCSELVRAFAYANNRDAAYQSCTSRVKPL